MLRLLRHVNTLIAIIIPTEVFKACYLIFAAVHDTCPEEERTPRNSEDSAWKRKEMKPVEYVSENILCKLPCLKNCLDQNMYLNQSIMCI